MTEPTNEAGSGSPADPRRAMRRLLERDLDDVAFDVATSVEARSPLLPKLASSSKPPPPLNLAVRTETADSTPATVAAPLAAEAAGKLMPVESKPAGAGEALATTKPPAV